MNDASTLAGFVGYIQSPTAIREQAEKIYRLTVQGKGHFDLFEDRLQETADFVVDLIQDRYPDLDIPYHSRWRHFEVPGTRALDSYTEQTANLPPIERARIGVDLIIPSVLLDAGAGSVWHFQEPVSQITAVRSEGLGLASINMFLQGAFSSRSDDFLRTDGAKLIHIPAGEIAEGMQVSSKNPLVGLNGRVQLLRGLGSALNHQPGFFPNARPGDLVDYLLSRHGNNLTAYHILKAVLQSLGEIWPGRLQYRGINLGDVWLHRGPGEDEDSYVPYHKLSQWLTYSIIETLETAGIPVEEVDSLTGLAEYRNGGLFIDSRVIELKSQDQDAYEPDHPVIIEWRGLTIHLLDTLAILIRQRLNKSAEQLPLARILEGGTWLAGRKLAEQLRADATSPINLISDGTVF